MATSELTIGGIGPVGEADAVDAIESFTWSVGLKQISLSSEVSVFSAQIAVLQIVDDGRLAFIRCLDEAGNEYLRFNCTNARVRGYTVTGSTERAREQYTLECSSIEMISGDQFSALDS
jgi:hypothetical protein